MERSGGSKPWEDVPNVWKDEKAYLNWLRSQTRRIWSRHPIKIAYIQNKRYKAPVGRNGREVWVTDCEMCGKQDRNCEVDHIKAGGSFSCWQTYTEWARRILWVSLDDLRLLCKDCHASVTYADRHDISVEAARAIRTAIAICKAREDKVWLVGRGVEPESTQAKRRKQVEEILLSEI